MTTCALEAPPPKAMPQFDHLSFSSIRTYQACPRKFAFKYVEKHPGEFTPSCFAFGGAFHRAVERVHEALMVGNPIPNAGELVSAFDAAWSELVESGTEVRFGKDENRD